MKMSEAKPKLKESYELCRSNNIKSVYEKNFVKVLYERYAARIFGDSATIQHTLELNVFHISLRRLLENEYIPKLRVEIAKLTQARHSFSVLEGPLDCLTFDCMNALEARELVQLDDTVLFFPISRLERN